MPRPITPELVLTGYLRGAFPMCDPVNGRVEWFTCDPRALVPLDGRFRVSDSLARTVRSGRFEVRTDTAFAHVMEGCARDRSEENRNWIGPEIRRVYGELHAMGFAHSVEAWRDGELVGGLYGVAVGRIFHGESMFHRRSDASKVGFVRLVERLIAAGFVLIDCQMPTEHLASLGAFAVRRADFLACLRAQRDLPPTGDPWINPDACPGP